MALLTTDLHLSGPTVTLFGVRDLLDAALSDELGRRGCSTHAVTTHTGWLTSVTNAIIRIDTSPGEHALEDLASRDVAPAHLVVVSATSDDDELRARFDELCRRCGDHHDVSMIWHSPLGMRLDEGDAVPVIRPTDLASAIADEIGHQEAWTSAPSFSTQTYAPGRHRGHS